MQVYTPEQAWNGWQKVRYSKMSAERFLELTMEIDTKVAVAAHDKTTILGWSCTDDQENKPDLMELEPAERQKVAEAYKAAGWDVKYRDDWIKHYELKVPRKPTEVELYLARSFKKILSLIKGK